MVADATPRLLWRELICLEPGRGYALASAVRHGESVSLLLVVPFDAPGPAPINAFERFHAQLADALGQPPTDVYVAFPELGPS